MKINKIFLAFLFLTSATACAENEEVTVNGARISLNTEKCTITTANNNETRLALEPNCFFVKKSGTEQIRVEHYADIASRVLLVVGSSVKNHPDFPITQSRNDCGNQLQAIKISDKGNVKTAKLISDTITCAGTGVDEKEYWMLAH